MSLTPDRQDVVMNGILNEARIAFIGFSDAAWQMQRPCVLFRPEIAMDGNKWCALYGANLMEGVAGFGDSPDEAMQDFDNEWRKKRNPAGEEGRGEG